MPKWLCFAAPKSHPSRSSKSSVKGKSPLEKTDVNSDSKEASLIEDDPKRLDPHIPSNPKVDIPVIPLTGAPESIDTTDKSDPINPRGQEDPSNPSDPGDPSGTSDPHMNNSVLCDHYHHKHPKTFLNDVDPNETSNKHDETDSEKSKSEFSDLNSRSEDCYVTPFAQILVSLKQIRGNICTVEESLTENKDENTPEKTKILCRESIDEIDWCLQQLEGITPSKSVSALASSKFIKLMNKELRQAATTKGGEQVQRFIQNTFMECKINKKIKLHSSVPPVQSPPSDFSKDHENNPFGIKSDFPEELGKFMESLDTWGIDTFQANPLTNGRPLAAITFTIFKKRQLIEKFCITPSVLLKYMTRVEESYQASNSYHNSLHAADVTQSVHVLLNCKKVVGVFSDVEVMSLVFGAAIHDVNHPGVTNLYLINTNNQLALLYNDISVLENHHLAVAFEIMREEGCNIFEKIDSKDMKAIRKLTIDLVLSTDMSKHMKLLADLKSVVESHRICKNEHLESHNDRIEIMKNIIHLADLSNPAKPWPVYVKWVDCITNEFYNQGDKEKEKGLEISPMCDRANPSIEKQQVSFIDFIVHPLYETWSEFVDPEGLDMINILVDNRDRYVRLAEQKKCPSEDVGLVRSSSSGEEDD